MARNSDELDNLIMMFRDLRCSSVNNMAIMESNRRLGELQKSLNDQFLTLAIGVVGLALSIVQTVVVVWTQDATTRLASLVVIVATGVCLVAYLINTHKTGRAARLREIQQKIDSAADAENEYKTLKITAEENIIPIIDVSLKRREITPARYKLLKERITETVSFFDKQIGKKESELESLKAERERLQMTANAQEKGEEKKR